MAETAPVVGEDGTAMMTTASVDRDGAGMMTTASIDEDGAVPVASFGVVAMLIPTLVALFM